MLGAVVLLQGCSAGVPALTPPPGAGAAGPGSVAQGETGIGNLRLDRLAVGAEDLDPAERNPFQFGVTPAPTVPLPAPASPASGTVDAGPGVLPIPLRYIGILDLPGQPGLVAVWSDNRGHVFHGMEGDVMEGRYRLLRVDADSADLADLDGRGQQTIEMSGQ